MPKTVLCAALSDAGRVREASDLMGKIEARCDYRHTVVRDWTDKSAVSPDVQPAERAELGNKLFRRLDSIVGRADRKHISGRSGTEISKNKQKSKQGRR